MKDISVRKASAFHICTYIQLILTLTHFARTVVSQYFLQSNGKVFAMKSPICAHSTRATVAVLLPEADTHTPADQIYKQISRRHLSQTRKLWSTIFFLDRTCAVVKSDRVCAVLGVYIILLWFACGQLKICSSLSLSLVRARTASTVSFFTTQLSLSLSFCCSRCRDDDAFPSHSRRRYR